MSGSSQMSSSASNTTSFFFFFLIFCGGGGGGGVAGVRPSRDFLCSIAYRAALDRGIPTGGGAVSSCGGL